MTHEPPQPADPLSPRDAAAVDAVLARRAGEASPHDDSPEQIRVDAILSLLGTTKVVARPELVDVTLARVQRAAQRPSLRLNIEDEPGLHPEDEDALDALVAAGFDPVRVNSTLRPRAAKMCDIGGMITAVPLRASPDLTERTYSKVASLAMARPAGEQFAPSGGRFRFTDLVTVAAMITIVGAVMWPVMQSVRVQQIKSACGANMATIAAAFTTYAGDYRGSLPVATASLGTGKWWDVGTSRSNSANLFQLPKERYIAIEDLACQGNPRAIKACCVKSNSDWGCIQEVSYSYQLMFGPARPIWSGEASVILTDKSPVVMRAVRGQVIKPLENSANHCGTGQWCLSTDGSAQWATTPQRGEDNIWLPAFLDEIIADARRRGASGVFVPAVTLRGNELPASARDTFVGP
ncbi:MAG: hypothetical protein KF864_11385 [Phycisphaeraceae bacterium]|nr:hypothetical protein [Phycisphaeraceae bacterium]